MVVVSKGDEEIIVPVSALRHYCFCARRCALQYVEGVWADNRFTLEGDELHERVDTPGFDERAEVRVVRALPIFSDRLGLSGIADLVEFHAQASGVERPYPVEYKRGVTRKHEQAAVQVCAQGICLEEMFGVEVEAGALYFGASRRRREIRFTEALRAAVEETVAAVRSLIREQRTPPAVRGEWCEGCSFKDSCLPAATEVVDRSTRYLATIGLWAAGGAE